MEDRAWDAFVESGRVEDYLRYKRENEENARCGDRALCEETGEDAVWEKPLR